MMFDGGRPFLFALMQFLLVVVDTAAETYDFIVIGAGAGGCALTKTLVDDGRKVLLVERGKERNPETLNIKTSGAVLHSECTEQFSSNGVVVAVGNCMGGGTSINQGIWILETPAWLKENIEALVGQDEFFDEGTILNAYTWATSQMAQVTEEKPGTGTETFVDALATALETLSGIDMVNMGGQPVFPGDGTVFRPFTIFEAETGNRRSADTILDRDNANLYIMTEKEVEKILFDGDDGIPDTSSVQQEQVEPGALPTARCVQFVQGGVECVKIGGRIYISAGVFHTPELLMKSGIGRNGVVVDNEEVGQHLSDKPVITAAYNFDPDFDLDGFITYTHVAAGVESEFGGERRMLVTEPYSLGSPGAIDFLTFNRALFPKSLRDSKLSLLVSELLRLCDSSKGDKNPICIVNAPFEEAGCAKQVVFLSGLVGDPSSEGSVTIGKKGKLEIDVNHLSTREDIEAFGAHARRGFELARAIQGESAPVYPCDENEKDPKCQLTTCPNLFKTLQDLLILGISVLYPKEAKGIPYKKKETEASVIFPNTIEFFIGQGLDDYELGMSLRENVFSSYHYAGTARFGSVIDSRFKVKGTEGLYVADSSALPKSTRVNAMATTVAIGRLAGNSALAEVP